MPTNNAYLAKNLDFKLATPDEIGQQLGLRLQRLRKTQGWTQQELADRAGLDVGTIKNLEKKGQCSLLTLIRVSTALDCVNDFSRLFQLKIKSIAALEKSENSKPRRIRQRVR